MIYPRLLICMAILACNNSNPKQTTSSTSIPAAEDTLAQMPGSGAKTSVSTDEQLFETAFGSFRTAVEQNSEEQLRGMMDASLPKDILSADVRSAILKVGEVDKKEVHNAELHKITDKDSKLFEVQAAKTGLIFGRVHGTYKVVGYNSK